MFFCLFWSITIPVKIRSSENFIGKKDKKELILELNNYTVYSGYPGDSHYGEQCGDSLKNRR